MPAPIANIRDCFVGLLVGLLSGEQIVVIEECASVLGDTEVWRLKIGNRGGTVDHRVFFDVDDDGLVFLAVEHWDHAYQ